MGWSASISAGSHGHSSTNGGAIHAAMSARLCGVTTAALNVERSEYQWRQYAGPFTWRLVSCIDSLLPYKPVKRGRWLDFVNKVVPR